VTAPVRTTYADGRGGRRVPAALTGAPVADRHAATNREQSLRTGELARRADPAAMSPEARLAELSSILATGYRRLYLAREKSLDDNRDSEAQCGPMVDAHESKPVEAAR